jgi:hypothetical protein
VSNGRLVGKRRSQSASHPNGEPQELPRSTLSLVRLRVTVKRNPMLEEALVQVRGQAPDLARKALLFQLHRHKALGY